MVLVYGNQGALRKLDTLRAGILILTGMAGDICALYTANEAYMRGYELYIPGDCIASKTYSANRQALGQMRRHLKADTKNSDKIDLDSLVAEKPPDS